MTAMEKQMDIEKNNSEETKRPEQWFGVRHVQVTLLFLLLTIGYAMRVNLSVGIVAMTDKNSTANPDIPTYDWKDKSTVLSSFYWGYVMLQILAGDLAKHYGPKWFITIAMIINCLACVSTPFMADKLGSYGVMGCRFAQGLAQGFFYPSVHSLLGRWAPTPERSRIGTFVYGGSSFGTLIGMPLTGLIAASWVGWPVSFYVFGAIGMSWVVAWIFLGSNSPAEHKSISYEERYYIESTLGHEKDHKVYATPWKSIVTSLPVWAILIANLGQNWGYATLLTEIPNYLNKIMHFEMAKNSFTSAAPYLLLWILSFVFGPLSDAMINRGIASRATVRKIFNTIGVCVPAVGLLLLTFVPDEYPSVSVTLLIVLVGVNAAVFCGFQVNHIDLSPNHAGTLMGISNGLGNIFSIVAPLAVQVIVTDETDKSLWRIVFIIAAVSYVSSAIFYIIFASGEIQYWNQVETEPAEATKDGEISKEKENSRD